MRNFKKTKGLTSNISDNEKTIQKETTCSYITDHLKKKQARYLASTRHYFSFYY